MSLDRHPDKFGAFSVRSELGAGRFGPVYAGRDPSDVLVVIHTFEFPTAFRGSTEKTELLDSLRKLCANCPDHPSIARPLAVGVEGNTPYLVSAHLAGTGMDVSIRTDGPRPLDDVLARVTHIATTIDLASASGLYHGMLEPADVIFDAENTGVTGFGLAQALLRVGIPVEGRSPYASAQRQAGALPTSADDVYSLAAIALELVIGKPSVGTQDPEAALRQAQGLPERRRVPRPAPHETRLFTAIPGIDAGKLRAVFAAAFSEESGERPATGAAFVASFKEAIVDRFEADRPASVNAVSAFASEDESPVTPTLSKHVSSDAIQRSSDAIQRPSDTIQRSSDAIQRSSDAIQRPSDAIQRSSDTIQRPSDAIQRPSKVVQRPSDTIERRSNAPAPIDLPLRRPPSPDPEMLLSFAEPVVHESPSIVRPPTISGPTWETPAPRGTLAFPLTVGVTLALLAGFAGGYAVGKRSAVSTPSPSIAGQGPAPASGASNAAGDSAASGAVAPGSTPTPVGAPEPIAETPPPTTSQPPVVAREPAKPEPSKPEPPSSGRLLVRSTPAGAGVSVDGKSRGSTPLAVRDLPLGDHTIEISSVGYDTRQQRVRLTARRPARSIDFQLRPSGAAAGQALAVAGAPGGLQVSSRPVGAEVFLDDNLIGTTPLLVSTVTAGSHRLRLEMPGYQTWLTTVQIESGARFRIAASLEQ